MAQLPPKFPSNISSFNHHPGHSSMSSFFLSSSATGAAPAAAAAAPSLWVDEFFDFASLKRGSHRRAMSDSIAFFESAPSEDGAAHAMTTAVSFDRLDEEQLMSMFSDDLHPLSSAPQSTAPSTPSSDHNSIIDQDKQNPLNSSANDQSEAQSGSNNGETPSAAVGLSGMIMASALHTAHPIIDPRRVKRILANRQSAQRSRVRKLQYISELEKSVTTLESEVSALSPRVAYLDHQRSVLTVGNSQLKQRIAALAQEKIFKDAHQEALQIELERLRQLYHRQNLKKTAAVAGDKPDGPAISADKKINIPAGTDHDPSSKC